MPQWRRNGWIKLAGASVIAAVLVTAACTKVEPGVPASTIAPAQTEQKEPQEKLRTDEIFDRAKTKGRLSVRYLWFDGDVAMGDSILIETPDGKTMLIDAGIPEAGPQVVQYLDKLGIDTLDVALNTHPHSDHIGGFATVAAGKKIDAFYMENFPYTNSSYYRNSMAAVNAKNIPITYLEEGSTFKLGSDVTVEVLSPPKGALPGAIKTYQAAEINDYSMVFKLTYKENSFLFTADIYKHREIELAGSSLQEKLKTDMMHAPHHGSESTSSSEIFIRETSPSVVVLSQNLFVSPNLMDRFKGKSIAPYSTGYHGNVLLVSDGKTISVVTEREGKKPIKTGMPSQAPAEK